MYKHINWVLSKIFIHIIRIYTPQRPTNSWHIFQLLTSSTHSLTYPYHKLNEKWNYAWTLNTSIKTNTSTAATRMTCVCVCARVCLPAAGNRKAEKLNGKLDKMYARQMYVAWRYTVQRLREIHSPIQMNARALCASVRVNFR